MKSLVPAALILLTSVSPSFADEVQGEPAVKIDSEKELAEEAIDAWRTQFRGNKAQAVVDAMRLEAEELEAFWEVYSKYEEETKVLGDKKVDLIKEYALYYDSLADKQAELLITKYFDLEQDYLSVRKKYADELSKALSPSAAARFVQLENRIKLLLDIGLTANIPLIEKT